MRSSLGEGYKFSYKKGPSQKDGPLVCTHSYTFRTKSNKRYVAQVEQFLHHIYVIKFYPLTHKTARNKYKVLTGDGNAGYIITTCVRIFLDIYNRDPLASAGFIGEASEGEAEENTKRFRVYIKAVGTFIGTDKFRHHFNVNASSYFLESLTNPEPHLREAAEEMFNKFYVLPKALQLTIDPTLGGGG